MQDRQWQHICRPGGTCAALGKRLARVKGSSTSMQAGSSSPLEGTGWKPKVAAPCLVSVLLPCPGVPEKLPVRPAELADRTCRSLPALAGLGGACLRGEVAVRHCKHTEPHQHHVHSQGAAPQNLHLRSLSTYTISSAAQA